MTATARRAKKSIKEDQLVTATVRASEWAQEHFNQVIIGVVALVAAVAVLVFVANSRQNNARQAERLMGQAMAQMQSGDLNGARTSFDEISKRQGGDNAIAARFFKAECELRLGNYQAAATEYDAYLARSGDYPVFASTATIGKGLAYEGLGQWEQAAEAHVEALEMLDKNDPRYYETAYRAGYCYERNNEFQQAVMYYQMVADNGSGRLRDRARIALAALK